MNDIDYSKLKAGYLNKPDAMRKKADAAFGDLINPKRAAIQESASAKDLTPVRKYKDGGVVNESKNTKLLSQSVRTDGKLYKKGGKTK